jgi:hypothetical protein
MASRRLSANPAFTTHFNAATYTQEGLNWIAQTEGLKDVIHRHYPELAALITPESAFTAWSYQAPRRCPQWLWPWQPRATKPVAVTKPVA